MDPIYPPITLTDAPITTRRSAAHTATKIRSNLRAASALAKEVMSGTVPSLKNAPPTQNGGCVSAYAHFARAYQVAKNERRDIR